MARYPRTGSLLVVTKGKPDPRTRLRFHIDPESAPRQGGAGGWVRVERPRRVEAVYWSGLPAYTVEMDLLFGTDATASVEADCLRLQRMARPAVAGAEPPVLQLALYNYAALRWVIESIVWSGEVREAGDRIRATATVSFVEYHSLDVRTAISKLRASNTAVGGGSSVPGVTRDTSAARQRTYTVKGTSETFGTISKLMLGTINRADEIAKLNGMPNNSLLLKPGMTLKIPAS